MGTYGVDEDIEEDIIAFDLSKEIVSFVFDHDIDGVECGMNLEIFFDMFLSG